MNIAERIRESRRSVVEVGGYKFTIRRPTDAEALTLSAMSGVDVVAQFVDGWEGVTEHAILGNGNGGSVKFDAEVWREWSADKPELWGPLFDAIITAYKTHRGTVEDAAKN